MRVQKFIYILLLVWVGTACDDAAPSKSKKVKMPIHQTVPVLKYSVDAKLPHSTRAFTEGLLFHEGQLFESTGSPGNLPETVSIYGVVDSISGEIEAHNQLDKKYFGEGMAILNKKVYQFTYTSRIGFVYDLETKKQLTTFQIPTKEGWGLTTDGTHLIMSDGSSSLRFLDPNTLEVVKTLPVFMNGRPANYLNELEYVNGFIYANVYTTNWMVKIDPSQGKIVAKIDLTDLKLEEDRTHSAALETNGIAYNPDNKKFYVTGKMWKNIYVLNIFE